MLKQTMVADTENCLVIELVQNQKLRFVRDIHIRELEIRLICS